MAQFKIPNSKFKIILLLSLAILASACTRTILVPTETQIRTVDTLRLVSRATDTLRLADTILIDRTADTVRIMQSRTSYRTVRAVDTLWRVRIDTVRITSPPAQLNAAIREAEHIQQDKVKAADRSRLTAWMLLTAAILIIVLYIRNSPKV